MIKKDNITQNYQKEGRDKQDQTNLILEVISYFRNFVETRKQVFQCLADKDIDYKISIQDKPQAVIAQQAIYQCK